MPIKTLAQLNQLNRITHDRAATDEDIEKVRKGQFDPGGYSGISAMVNFDGPNGTFDEGDEPDWRPMYERVAAGKKAREEAEKKGKDGAFTELEKKLESKGESKHEAGAVAYKVGTEKYGKEGMAKKAAAGRK